ncbi:MAG: HAD family hydrolase [Pacificimonas sp.]
MTKRPLLACDCDEVILAFAQPLVAHLAEEHALTLSFDSFALAGNIRDAHGKAVDPERIGDLIDHFFDHGMARQTMVPGAAEALNTLSEDFDIVVLTNIKSRYREARRAQLLALDIDFDIVPNQGSKAPALARLLAERGHPPAVFIDDLPPHHEAMKVDLPAVHCVHMVADKTLASMIPPAPAADTRIDHWPGATAHLRTLLAENRLASTAPASA